MTITITPLTLSSLDRLGTILGRMCIAGDIICLGGELGAGKTTLTQAIARGAGVDKREYVSSPTFAYMHEYKGVIPFYHMDFYRLGSSDDVLELGLDEFFYQAGITVIEWPERAVQVIPQTHLLLQIEIIDQQQRKITMSSPDLTWEKRLAILEKTWSIPP